jgi:hypothetical protein
LTRIAPALVLIAALLAAGPGEAKKRQPRDAANPSAVIAAEIAFNRMAQEKGQWTAFREFAAKDATMFAPQPVNALDWLKGRANPAQSLQWQPHRVWSSCDGEYAITWGAWQNADKQGWFSTVWRRDNKGTLKWVLDQGGDMAVAPPAPEMIEGKVASCRNLAAIEPALVPVPLPGTQVLLSESSDKTLRWVTRIESDASRFYAIEYWNGSTFERPVATPVPAP